jgi:hypothetical protein
MGQSFLVERILCRDRGFEGGDDPDMFGIRRREKQFDQLNLGL